VHKTILVIVLAGSAMLTGACRESSAPNEHTVAPIAVSTTPVTSTTVASSLEAGGVVTSRTTAVIASRIMAPVAAVHVRAGDRVRRGAPLVTLDGRELDANRARAIATLASAAESQLAAESELRSAQAALTLARATHDRIRRLHDQRSATPQELDQAISALDVADAQFTQANAHRSAADAAHDAARAASDAASITTSYATLSAPFDGVVTELHHVAEELIEPKVISSRCEPDRLADLLLRLGERAGVPARARRDLERLDHLDDRDALGDAPAGRERDGLAVVVCDELGDFFRPSGSAKRNTAQALHQALECGLTVDSPVFCYTVDQPIRGGPSGHDQCQGRTGRRRVGLPPPRALRACVLRKARPLDGAGFCARCRHGGCHESADARTLRPPAGCIPDTGC